MDVGATISTRNVRLAAEDVRRAINSPENERASRIREAKRWLLSAADEQGLASAKASQLFFAAPAQQSSDETRGDPLAAILSDAQVGTTLIAAGHALGETGAATGTVPLDDAISSLETAEVSQSVTVLHFAAEAAHSKDFDAAAKTLSSRTEETFKTLLAQAHSAGAQVLEELKKILQKIDFAKALEALSEAGGPFTNLPQMGELVKKGVEKLQNATETLLKLLEDVGLGAVKEKIEAYRNKLADGTLIDSLLSWAFGRESIEAAIKKVTASATISISEFDKASDLLPPLGDEFKKRMEWAKALTRVITAVSGVLFLFGVISVGPLAASIGGAYLLILAAILLIGRDYAGEGNRFAHRKGVRAIVESLAI